MHDVVLTPADVARAAGRCGVSAVALRRRVLVVAPRVAVHGEDIILPEWAVSMLDEQAKALSVHGGIRYGVLAGQAA